LCCGPLVLFSLADGAAWRPSRRELLGASQIAKARWEVRSDSARHAFLPYVEIAEEPYTTFLNVAV
jgi:hypothetical protein